MTSIEEQEPYDPEKAAEFDKDFEADMAADPTYPNAATETEN